MWSEEAKSKEAEVQAASTGVEKEEVGHLNGRSLVDRSFCEHNTGKILAAVSTVGKKVDGVSERLERHLGVHEGKDKANERRDSKIVMAAKVTGVAVAAGSLAIGCMKLFGG